VTPQLLRSIVLAAIDDERKRQDEKWGEQNHGDLYWLGILVEEVGELAQSIIQHRLYEETEKELLHVAAVAVSWAECHLRNTGPAVDLYDPQVKFAERSR
jgi:NTP pyrophosphatase (non-canonical NTP hydrolase)